MTSGLLPLPEVCESRPQTGTPGPWADLDLVPPVCDTQSHGANATEGQVDVKAAGVP